MGAAAQRPGCRLCWGAALPSERPVCCALHGFVSVRRPSVRDTGTITERPQAHFSTLCRCQCRTSRQTLGSQVGSHGCWWFQVCNQWLHLQWYHVDFLTVTKQGLVIECPHPPERRLFCSGVMQGVVLHLCSLSLFGRRRASVCPSWGTWED